MNEPIKEGDLVVLVRGHSCALNEAGGVPFVFGKTHTYSTAPRCARCKESALFGAGTHPRLPQSLGGWVTPIEWLKRIPPPEELEGEKRSDEVEA